MPKVLVVAEVKGGELKKPSAELLTKTRQAGLDTEAVLIGSGVGAAADAVAGHGATAVYVADDAALEHFNAATYLPLLSEAVEKAQPTQVWFSVSEASVALAPALAAKLDSGYVGGCTGLEIDGDAVTCIRPAMATKVLQKLQFAQDGVRVLSVRSGAFDAEPASATGANVVALSAGTASEQAVVKEILAEESDEIDLGEASMIVSVGRGVKGPEGVESVRPLAKLLGAAFGASRAVVDSGWMPHSAQVGQTGRVVNPDVYFAIGISGAIQHMAGMSGSKLIVAVNKDPDAPIFSIADYGIVADLFKAVPVLAEEFEKAKS